MRFKDSEINNLRRQTKTVGFTDSEYIDKYIESTAKAARGDLGWYITALNKRGLIEQAAEITAIKEKFDTKVSPDKAEAGASSSVYASFT